MKTFLLSSFFTLLLCQPIACLAESLDYAEAVRQEKIDKQRVQESKSEGLEKKSETPKDTEGLFDPSLLDTRDLCKNVARVIDGTKNLDSRYEGITGIYIGAGWAPFEDKGLPVLTSQEVRQIAGCVLTAKAVKVPVYLPAQNAAVDTWPETQESSKLVIWIDVFESQVESMKWFPDFLRKPKGEMTEVNISFFKGNAAEPARKCPIAFRTAKDAEKLLMNITFSVAECLTLD